MTRTLLAAIFLTLSTHPVLAAKVVGEAAGEVVAEGKVLNSKIVKLDGRPMFVYSVAYDGNLYYCIHIENGVVECKYPDK
ncbi:hypothetical protein OAW66_01600 [Alphaproteobacteria bacterium]|nr:hypothetical protein [Alphaproteobacteria bacterium]